MRRILLLGVALVLGVGVLPASVYAQAEQEEPVTNQTDDTQPVTPVNEEQNDDARSERLKNYKDRASEKLTFAQERKLQQTCTVAQKQVEKLQEKTAKIKENRQSKYSTIVEKLDTLASKLDLAGIDASKLRDSIASLESEAEIFNATLTDYETILNDLASMDCASDAEGFKAALVAARQQRSTLVSSSGGIKKIYSENIKPLLQQLRQDLET